MKIEIKPKILTVSDYHDFTAFTDNTARFLGSPVDFYEIDSENLHGYEFFRAILWPEGAEDELFEFLFTNQEAWEALTEEE